MNTDLTYKAPDNFNLQTATIPYGLTASNSKYVINTSNADSGNPVSFLYTPLEIHQTKVILGDDLTRFIKSGNLIQLRLHNYKQLYEISKSYYVPSENYTHIIFDDTVYKLDTLSYFVSSFPTPLNDVSVCVGINNELAISNSYIESFDIKMRYNNNDNFNLYLSWSLSFNAAIAKFRWRKVPTPDNSISEWTYENSTYKGENSRTLTGFEYNNQYEIEILSANNDYFKDKIYYSNNVKFQFTK